MPAMYSGVTFYTNNPLCLRASVVNRIWIYLFNRFPELQNTSLYSALRAARCAFKFGPDEFSAL